MILIKIPAIQVFHGNEKAQRALPALVAISAFGNIVNATFVASKGQYPLLLRLRDHH